MASPLEDADRKRALQLTADCSQRCQSCGMESMKSDDPAMADCVSGCLDCSVLCGGAEMLLTRKSSFDVRLLWLAVEAAAT